MSLSILLQNWKIFSLIASSVSFLTSLALKKVFSLVNCSVMEFVYKYYFIILIYIQ